jgi:nucleotide-binding universal stress UspA family protein
MYEKVIVPLDSSKLAECVLPHVEALSRGCQVKEVVFVSVVEPLGPIAGEGYVLDAENTEAIETEMKAASENYLSALLARTHYGGVRVEWKVLSGRVAETLADFATSNGADLIVIATHGRAGVSRWVLGSVADRILRSSCVPVLMIRAPGCVPGV